MAAHRSFSVVVLALGLVLPYTSTQESDFYTAAVVEYAPFELRPEAPNDPGVLLKKNAINHMYFMKQAASKGVDIIVFPECGLTGINLPSSRHELRPYLTEIPEPGRANPCVDTSLNTSQLLRDLSCASRRHRIYSVMNLPEVAACTSGGSDGDSSCPPDGEFIFNTNIVFDRQGNLIARYRKYNLFVEPGFNAESTAAHSMFDTDFGVKFGMFICFDIFFHEPAVAMVTQHNLTDIVYSAAWFSELPFITAVQTQAEWAYAMDTNFLAAGYNNPKNRNTGSGIYAGRDGAVTAVMAFDEMNQMLIAQVKKKKRSKTSGTSLRNVQGLIRNKRESSEAHNISVQEIGSQTLPGTTTQKTFSYEASKSFINYLLQHVRKKGTENPFEVNRCKKGDGVNTVRRELPAVKVEELLNQPQNPMDIKHYNKYDPHIHIYNTALLNLTNVTGTDNHTGTVFLCHLHLCCNFTLSSTTNKKNIPVENTIPPQEFYHVGVYDGSKIDNYQTCLVLRCTGPDVRSCENVDYSALQTSTTTFKTIIIEGNFKENGNIKTQHSREMNGSFESVIIDDHIVMRNVIQIHNLSRVALQVDGFPNQNNESVGKYGYLDPFQEDLSIYNTVILGTENVNKNISVCQGNLCCEFYIGTVSRNPPMSNGSLISSNGYHFRVGVFGGTRSLLRTINAGMQVCAMFSCTGEDILTCGLLKNHSDDQTVSTILNTASRNNNHADNGFSDRNFGFEKIKIKGNFDNGNLIMPNTLTSKLLAFKTDTFSLKQEHILDTNANKTLVVMETANRRIDDVLTFGVFARDFRKDNDWHKTWYQILTEI